MKEILVKLLTSKSALVALILVLILLFNPLGLGHILMVILAIVGVYFLFKTILPKWFDKGDNGPGEWE